MSSSNQNVDYYYPNKLIGAGAYKYVFDLTKDINPSKEFTAKVREITNELENVSLPTNQRKILTENLSVMIYFLFPESRKLFKVSLSNKLVDNVVMIAPKNQPLTLKEAKNFESELKLQEKFALKGLAPRVLQRHKKRVGEHYNSFAITYRCAFTICDYDYLKIADKLRNLFDGVAKEGYIYTDIKEANMCLFTVNRTNTSKFLFVDFDEKFMYKYDGFNPNPNSDVWKQHFTIEEIISNMMEFMFLNIILSNCANINCKFCNNSSNIFNRILELIRKYVNRDVTMPLVSLNQTNPVETLLDLNNINFKLLSPNGMLFYYLKINGKTTNDKKNAFIEHIGSLIKTYMPHTKPQPGPPPPRKPPTSGGHIFHGIETKSKKTKTKKKCKTQKKKSKIQKKSKKSKTI